jgi:carboxyl-terminal processing protease
MVRAFLLSCLFALALVPLACTEEMDANPDAYVGIGVELTMEAAGARVVRVLPGSPAGAAGLAAGDVVLEIGDTSARGKTLAEVVKQLRGEPGSQVTMLARTADGNKQVTVTRAPLQNR